MKRGIDISAEGLAEDLLGRPYDDLDEEEKRVLCRVASTEIELDPDEFDVVNTRFGDRAADRAVLELEGSGEAGDDGCLHGVLLADTSTLVPRVRAG